MKKIFEIDFPDNWEPEWSNEKKIQACLSSCLYSIYAKITVKEIKEIREYAFNVIYGKFTKSK